VEDYEDGDFTGQQYTFDGVPLTEFQGDGEESLSITRDGDVFHVAGVLDLATGLTSGATGLSGFDPSQFLQGADIQITMSFPGEVTESNGQISGNSVTWVPEIGERLEITATANATGSGGDSNLTILLIIGAVVVVLAVIAGVIFAQRRNRAARRGLRWTVPRPAEHGSGPPAPGARRLPLRVLRRRRRRPARPISRRRPAPPRRHPAPGPEGTGGSAAARLLAGVLARRADATTDGFARLRDGHGHRVAERADRVLQLGLGLVVAQRVPERRERSVQLIGDLARRLLELSLALLRRAGGP
jgi:hypothetical protein